jgi:hypothetical protein
MSKTDWLVFVDRLDLPPITLEERAAAIAAELRKGAPSELFCQMLASMIYPTERAITMPFALRLTYRKRGQPGRPNVALGKAMLDATEGVPRGRLKAVKQDVAARFGVTVRTAESAMQDELQFQGLSRLVDEAKRKERAE